MSNEREHIVQQRTREAVERVYAIAWGDGVTSAESRLIWMNVIHELIQSVLIDRQTEATSEWLSGWD